MTSRANWDDLRFVLAIARGGSIAAAARLLRVNESTVARRLSHIESKLSARLFDRNMGELSLTDAGATVAKCAERIEAEYMAAFNIVAGEDRAMTGTVRLTSVPILINRVLAPALPGILLPHPNLKVELISDPRSLSLTKREADVALRLARPNNEQRAIARKVADLSYSVYGPAGIRSESTRWITYDDRMVDLPQALWIANTARQETGTDPQ